MQEDIKKKLIDRFDNRVAFHRVERLLYASDLGTLPKMITDLIHNMPEAVVQPQNSMELTELIDLAGKNKIPLVPRGGGSAGYGGAVPTRGGIVVEFNRMNQIIYIDKKEKKVTVEPGVIMEELDRELRMQGLSLRVYPGSALSATVGGWLANGGGIGIGGFEYGYLKDNIVEVELVTPQGVHTINQESLDLVEGMAGTTGFISSITMLARDDVKDIPMVAAFPTIEILTETFNKISLAKLPLWEVSYKDMLNVEWSARAEEKQALKGPIVHEAHGKLSFPKDKYIVTFVYPDERQDLVEAKLKRLILASGGEVLSQELADLEWSEKFYGTRLKALGPSTIPTEVVIPTDQLDEFVKRIKSRVKDLAFFGTLVKGGKEGAFLGYRLDDERRRGFPLAFVNSFIPVKEAEKLGGRVYTIGMLLSNYAVGCLGQKRLDKAYQFKQKVDPDGIMNPGKVFPSSMDKNSPTKMLALLTKLGSGGLQISGANALDALFGGKPQGLSLASETSLAKMPFGKELAWDALACASCGYCRSGCTEYNQIGWESSSPRGKFKFFKEYIKGHIGFDERMAELIFACSTCGKCDNICQVRASIDGHWSVTARPLVWQAGFNPPGVIQGGAHNISVAHNPGAFNQEERVKWKTPDLKTTDEGEIGYFAGCNPSFAAGLRNLPVNSIRLFNKVGLEPVYMGADEWCCGGALYNVGCWEDAVENVKHNIEEMNRRGIKTLVTSCSGCWGNIAHFYPVMAKRIGIPFEIEVKHITQMLNEWIEEGKLKCKFPVDLSVTYHDPCHIGHGGGIFEEPRKILQSIPELKLIEMPHNRERANCCGRFLLRYPTYGMGIQSKRLNEALETGASALVTACATCISSFNQGINEAGVDYPVFDVTDLVCQSAGIPTLVMSKFMKLGIM
jgi:Fe-S oxidoreductase/FAD/FMN-containing dehydrogenase